MGLLHHTRDEHRLIENAALRGRQRSSGGVVERLIMRSSHVRRSPEAGYDANAPFPSTRRVIYRADLRRALVQHERRTEFLTRSEVSRLLGVSPNTVTRWAREGRLPCQVTLGGHHRFERAVVEELRQRLTRGGGSPS
jgi:excisionase family DNA binding protein